MFDLEEKQFEVIGTDGNSVKVSGQDLNKGLLLINADGTYSVVWEEGAGHKSVDNLLRIRSI